MFFASSWKVNQTPLLPHPVGPLTPAWGTSLFSEDSVGRRLGPWALLLEGGFRHRVNYGGQQGEQVLDKGRGVWWGLPQGRSGPKSKAWCVLLVGTPKNVGFEPVRDTLLSVPGVRATHELHLWSLTLTYHVASAHLAIGESTLAPASYFLETLVSSPPPANIGT